MSILGYIFTITDNIYYLICFSMFGGEYSFFKFWLETLKLWLIFVLSYVLAISIPITSLIELEVNPF